MKGKGIDSSWIFDDPRVPRGWAVREKSIGQKTSCQLLSPERMFFDSFRVALKYLIENQKPKENIDEMRKSYSELDEIYLNFYKGKTDGKLLKSLDYSSMMDKTGMFTLKYFLRSVN